MTLDEFGVLKENKETVLLRMSFRNWTPQPRYHHSLPRRLSQLLRVVLQVDIATCPKLPPMRRSTCGASSDEVFFTQRTRGTLFPTMLPQRGLPKTPIFPLSRMHTPSESLQCPQFKVVRQLFRITSKLTSTPGPSGVLRKRINGSFLKRQCQF